MLQVIGAGFGRTGTASLQAALAELGFGPCYHMFEVLDNPARVATWQAAIDGLPVDWDDVFASYQSCVDWPACAFYHQLMDFYPAAKVLLSVRDADRWYESVSKTIYLSRRARQLTPDTTGQARMIDDIIWMGTFGGEFEDKQKAIAIFNQHIQQVKDTVPPDRLLVFDVKEGWEPLCHFLNVPVPVDTPFPHLNDTAAFTVRIDHMIAESQRQGQGPSGSPSAGQ